MPFFRDTAAEQPRCVQHREEALKKYKGVQLLLLVTLELDLKSESIIGQTRTEVDIVKTVMYSIALSKVQKESEDSA
jgi:hypothetical protein